MANVEIAALVDVDGRRTEEAASVVYQKTGKRPKIDSDMRRIFEDKRSMRSRSRPRTTGTL